MGSAGAVAIVTAAVALEVALGLGIRQATLAVQPVPGNNVILPLQELLPRPFAPASQPRLIRQQAPEAKSPPLNALAPAAPVPADPPAAAPRAMTPPAPVSEPGGPPRLP